MSREIERKYLVDGDDFRREARSVINIAQGYLCRRKVTARIRIADSEAFLTIKNRSRDGGLSRDEWEWNIPVRCARMLLDGCSGVIEKKRYLVPLDDTHIIEVDEFAGCNSGLIIAEVELSSIDDHPSLPRWMRRDVTAFRFFSNSYLSAHPFNTWDKGIIDDLLQ